MSDEQEQYWLKDGQGPFNDLKGAFDALGIKTKDRPNHNRWNRLSAVLKEQIERRPAGGKTVVKEDKAEEKAEEKAEKEESEKREAERERESEKIVGQFTDKEKQFLNLLKMYPVTKPVTVAAYITTQGETVLEDPTKLAIAMAETDISPTRRRQILKHWFAQNNISLPDDFIQRSVLPVEELRKEGGSEKTQPKYAVETTTGAIRLAMEGEKALSMAEATQLQALTKKELVEQRKTPVVTYIYDTVNKEVRMAKDNEIGGTLDQAKELKQMAEASGKKEEKEQEPAFTVNSDGTYGLNPKARLTGQDILAFDMIRRSQLQGQALTPTEALIQAGEQIKSLRDLVTPPGGGPAWMQDPITFIKAIQELGGGGKADEAVMAQLTALRNDVQKAREERFLDQIDAQKAQVNQLREQLLELKEDFKNRPPTGTNELDIIQSVVKDASDVIKTELPGIRGMVKEAISGTRLPGPKNTEDRDSQKKVMREALAKDQKLDELEQKVFGQ
jgi:hypothetical protein